MQEAVDRIQSRIDRADQIKANALKVKEKNQLKNIWDQHKYIVEQMNFEMKLFKKQAAESMREILQELDKVVVQHHLKVREEWKFVEGGQQVLEQISMIKQSKK